MTRSFQEEGERVMNNQEDAIGRCQPSQQLIEGMSIETETQQRQPNEMSFGFEEQLDFISDYGSDDESQSQLTDQATQSTLRTEDGYQRFFEATSREVKPLDENEAAEQWRSPQVVEDEDSDIDADIPCSHRPSNTYEKRRAQNEVLRAYAAKRTAMITETEVKESMRGTRDEQLSIQEILAKQGQSSQITNPRDYQTELFQKAKVDNIIAVLDTGAGKTHIATLLLRHILDLELESRARGSPNRIAFFLVNSVNLVFQQANVLHCGLDQKVKGVCGAMGTRLWQKPTWDKLFADNMVIVCTADVLVQCMMHSFINMTMVNLLIFDEAHHAKNNHPYARLIKEYYVKELDVNKCPRIFGMTASPVDANNDITAAARDLEKLLHCKIATTSNPSLLRNNINRPDEEVASYAVLQDAFETSFHQKVKECYGDLPAFQKFFISSKLISSELGRWPSDMYWSFAFTEEESRKREIRQEFRYHKNNKNDSMDKLNEEIARLKEAAQFVQQHQFGIPIPDMQDLSSKVLLLHDWLQRYYARTGEARCIVFVQRRQTARLLQLIFSHIGGPNLRSDVLIGVSSTIGELNISLRSQVLTVSKFRKGELNCLFSTSVAEEGLDIPQCNLVVRFDLYQTMIAYVQSRGRARHRNSKYLHMVEHNNVNHRRVVLDVWAAEGIMRSFCEGLSGDRLLNEIDDDIDRFLASEPDCRAHIVPESGAKLTYRSSLSILAHFVASLPAPNREICSQPTYLIERVVDEGEQKFQCEVILPDFSPIISARGLPYKKKAVAKCSAAYEMCLQLLNGNFLDNNLLPIYTKHLPAMRNALLAISEKKKGKYPMRIKPEIWLHGYGTIPDCLYLTVIDVDAGLDRPHQPLGLLTRVPLPQLPPFPIYLNSGKASQIVSTPLRAALPTTEDSLNLFATFTHQIFLDIFNKDYEYDVKKMPYCLVPIDLNNAASISSVSRPENVIDVEQILDVCTRRVYKWTQGMEREELLDKYFVDPFDGGRRFYSRRLAPHLKPLDPLPSALPKKKYMKDNILEYSNSLWSNSRWKTKGDENQPVLEVERIPYRRNLLAIDGDDEDKARAVKEASHISITYVCPQFLRISSLTTHFVAMCYAFPAVIHRMESYLIALDACRLLDLKIGPSLALEAITKDTDVADEQGEERINFKSGMGPNYERLEFLGDCFLKMATSISTFVLQPDENEFEFHVRRMVMLCNKNLFNTATKLNLTEYIRSEGFSRRTWYPEGLKLLKGKGAKADGPKTLTHNLGDKTVADVCEAFIGAAFLEHNDREHWDPKNWDEAVKAVKILVNSEDHLMTKFSDYYVAYQKPKYQVAESTAPQLDMAGSIEKKHPYHFKYPRLLRSAFMHPSQAYMWEQVPNYQRLEFLGDSLLDMAFIMHLFYKYTDKDPHWLTEHKAPMVSNKFLGAVCVKLGFHTHIRQNNALLSTQIRDYIVEVEEAEREANGAVDYWVGVSEPPKCLADVVEAYVAAMFVDSKFDFSVVQTFFSTHLERYFVDMSLPAYESFSGKHPTTRLSKLLGISFGCREWRIAAMEADTVILNKKKPIVAMVLIHNKVCFDSMGESGRYARVRASQAALDMLEGLPPYEFRRQYGCDCEDDVQPDDEMSRMKDEERLKEAMGPAF